MKWWLLWAALVFCSLVFFSLPVALKSLGVVFLGWVLWHLPVTVSTWGRRLWHAVAVALMLACLDIECYRPVLRDCYYPRSALLQTFMPDARKISQREYTSQTNPTYKCDGYGIAGFWLMRQYTEQLPWGLKLFPYEEVELAVKIAEELRNAD